MIHNIFDKKTKKEKEIVRQKILVDYREKNSLVPGFLKKLGCEFEFLELKVGDYLIEDTIIERKEVKDFFSSIKDKRIFKQLEEMKQYPKQLLILEGNPYNTNFHENSVKGLILSINLNHKVPIIITRGYEETAKYIELLSREKKKNFSLAPTKKSLAGNEELEVILQSFKNVGPATAKKLLQKFGSLKKIFNLKEKDLEEFLGKNSKKFVETIKRKYNS